MKKLSYKEVKQFVPRYILVRSKARVLALESAFLLPHYSSLKTFRFYSIPLRNRSKPWNPCLWLGTTYPRIVSYKLTNLLWETNSLLPHLTFLLRQVGRLNIFVIWKLAGVPFQIILTWCCFFKLQLELFKCFVSNISQIRTHLSCICLMNFDFIRPELRS